MFHLFQNLLKKLQIKNYANCVFRNDDELSFDYDFVIVETEIYEQKKEENRDLFSALRYFADNGRLILFVENEDFCE